MALKNVLLLPFFLALAAAAPGARAQTVWRCGSSYGTQPCTGGTTVDVTDRSVPADVARARKATDDDMRRAEAMEKARLAALKDAPKALLIGPKEAASAPAKAKEHPKAHKGKKKDGKKEPEFFTAAVPKKK